VHGANNIKVLYNCYVDHCYILAVILFVEGFPWVGYFHFNLLGGLTIESIILYGDVKPSFTASGE
jgi:hypothetical protein